MTCLKQYIDYYFAKTVAQDINLLKICKFCNKAFLAVNPKAEYHTPQCKNKANVYKNRAKKTHSFETNILSMSGLKGFKGVKKYPQSLKL